VTFIGSAEGAPSRTVLRRVQELGLREEGLDIQLEILPTEGTTLHEAREVALLLRTEIERLAAVSGVEPVRLPAPGGAKGGEIESLQEFFVSLAPTGLKALFGLVKAIAMRPRQPKTIITVKTKSTQFQFEFDPTALSLNEIVENVSKLPGIA
jgi:hypothetical protein